MKNYGDLGGCYPPRPTASTDNALLDLHNTQPHSLTVNYPKKGNTIIEMSTTTFDIRIKVCIY